MKKIYTLLLLASVALFSCIQKEADNDDQQTLTDPEVQSYADSNNLTYVEEGAQDIITYEEVIAAQAAWCDALVQIGKLKEEGGDYRGFAEKVLSDAYNYDYGKA